MTKRYVVRRMTAVTTKSGEHVVLNNDNVNRVAEDVSQAKLKTLTDAGNIVALDVDEPEDATPLAAEAAVAAEEAASATKKSTSKKEK